MEGGFTRGNPPAHWHNIDTIRDGMLPSQSGFSGSAALDVQNGAIYVPVIVREPVTVKQLWYAGSTTATGNYDIGLYDAAGVKILSRGSTAKASSATENVWDCTDTPIGRGIYYLALATDSATDTFPYYTMSAPGLTAIGVLGEAAAFPLPATATFAINQALVVYPVIGMFLDTRVS